MVRVKEVTLLVIILLFWGHSEGQKISPKTIEIKPTTNIKQFNFKDFIYSKNKQISLMRITYGDLTGDQNEEAIVLLRSQNTRISRTLDEVFIYSLKNGNVIELTHFEAGRRGDYALSIESLGSNFKVEEKVFTLELAILREGEDVPTHYYTIKYYWNGVQMKETERSCLKPLPEAMQEVG